MKTSLLTDRIQAAKDDGYKLVIVRHKSRKFAEEPNWEPPQVKKYGREMAAYLQRQGIVFLDYEHQPELTIKHYANGDHLNRAGKAIWTKLMAEDLKAILAGKRAPRQPKVQAPAIQKTVVPTASTRPAPIQPAPATPAAESRPVDAKP